jgi:uncharacterized protein
MALMHPNAALITALYTAFQQRDGEAMARLYAVEAAFRDPVFSLRGQRVGAMWRMLCERATDLRITARDIRADDSSGSAAWEAWYSFGPSGRPVHNRIQAAFRFSDGKIVEHRDSFDLWRWARQALGWRGALLGWTPVLRAAIRRQAARGLERYCQAHGLHPTP